MIEVKEFADFFEAVHGPGVRPFSWQVELLKMVVTDGSWPEQIAAPTGAGKSSVIEIHVFATALAAVGKAPRLPRRMAVVVNRRAITDSHADRAEALKQLLEKTPKGDTSVVGRVRDALVGLRPSDSHDRAPLVVTMMRGAAASDSGWLNAPEACAVLCMTPAMWASSLLFRSYGASRFARPRLAGLLATDAVVILDEAHLNRQVVVTARRVAALAAPGCGRLGVPGLSVVEMTATPSSRALSTAGVTRASLHQDAGLAQRMLARKELDYLPIDAWPPDRRRQRAFHEAVVEQVNAEVDRLQGADVSGPRTVGCVLNRVQSAVEVAKALRGQGLRCELWVGRLRPWDLNRLKEKEPGLFSTSGSQDVDVLIATQTVEVGVDLDLAAMVTELASGSAIAQRAGRVNRLGLRDQARVVVVGPPAERALTKNYAPYTAADLTEGRRWALARQAAGSLAPIDVAENPPETDTPRRLLWQRPETWDVALWSKTSMDLVVEPQLDLWIRDDLDPDVENVGIVVRDLAVLSDVNAAQELVRKVPPQDLEAFPVSIVQARALVERHGETLVSSVLWRGSEEVPEWSRAVESGAPASVLRPGDMLVIDSAIPFVTEAVANVDGQECATPVPYEDLDGVWEVIVDQERLARLVEMGEEGLDALFPDGLREWSSYSEETVGPQWLVVRHGLVDDDNSDEKSTSSPGSSVLLADHNRDVADRADALAQAVGVGNEVTRVLHTAGLWHDIGKSDGRFQQLLGRRRDDLAKSRRRSSRSMRRAWADAGLPPGWRHEVSSAAAYWTEREDSRPQATTEPAEVAKPETGPWERDLVARLVGTSHGRGRPLFDHDPATAGPCYMGALDELLGQGEWESLIDRTDRAWGHWACAYLEALLRAADCSISSEGK